MHVHVHRKRSPLVPHFPLLRKISKSAASFGRKGLWWVHQQLREMDAVQAFPPKAVEGRGVGEPREAILSQVANYHRYPPALATYEDVVADAKLFWETLEKLHSSLGTKFMIPTVGGKELDLHKLFVEVTLRGGIEKIIHDRKWKEVTSSFSFPTTATNASFVLRKYYLSLLNHYERRYFFNSDGWNPHLPAPSPEVLKPVSFRAPARSPAPSRNTPIIVPSRNTPIIAPSQNTPITAPSRNTPTIGHKRRLITEQLKNGVNSHVSGIIDGKIQDGYLVSVHVGTELLRGIVYHVDDNSAIPPSSFCAADNTDHPVPGVRRKRRRKLSKLDPNHPKPNLSGYNFFFAEQHGKLKLIHSGKDREISKMIGELWNNLTEEEKAVYQEFGARDRERYRREMVIYRERQRSGGGGGGGGQIISNAVPIQQIPAATSVPVANEDQKMEDNNQRSPNDADTGGSTESNSDLEGCPEAELDGDSAHILDELTHEAPCAKMQVVGDDEVENEVGKSQAIQG